MLNVDDLLQTGDGGRGVVNILVADKLLNAPMLYSTLLLWLLSELYERLPEVGDRDKPKLVFFFDEAHLLFTDAPKILLDKIEQVVRLIRSKGVGVYFVTQNPLDVPETVLGQLGNRVQHALRAFTPRDQKAVKAAAETMRANPKLDTEKAITELGVGEALVSFLDAKGRPEMVERAYILPPGEPHRPGDAGRTAARHGGFGARRDVRQAGRSRIGLRAPEGARAGGAAGRRPAPAGGRQLDRFDQGLAGRPPVRQRAQGQHRRSGREERGANGGLDDRARNRPRRAGFAAGRAPALGRAPAASRDAIGARQSSTPAHRRRSGIRARHRRASPIGVAHRCRASMRHPQRAVHRPVVVYIAQDARRRLARLC